MLINNIGGTPGVIHNTGTMYMRGTPGTGFKCVICICGTPGVIGLICICGTPGVIGLICIPVCGTPGVIGLICICGSPGVICMRNR